MARGVSIDTGPFVRAAEAALRDFGHEGESFVNGIADQVVDVAQSLAPVASGALQASIRKGLAGRTSKGPYVDVGANVPYAIFVEYGTYKDRAQPFMRPALAAAGKAGRSAGLKTRAGGARAAAFRKRATARAKVTRRLRAGKISAGTARISSAQISNKLRVRRPRRRR